ncbi:MAG: SRPBCC family protein [Myxococcota bacterium]
MKWIVGGLVAIAVVAVVVYVFGATRPRSHVATATRAISAPPERVWATIVAFDQQATWRSAATAVRRVGDRIEETNRWGDVLALRVVEETAPARLVTEVVDQTAFGGTWTIELAPDGAGTRVTITERGEVHSVLFRAVGAVLFDPTRTAETWLADLDRAMSSTGIP